MSYSFRQRRQINYQESEDLIESSSSASEPNGHDRPRKLTIRRTNCIASTNPWTGHTRGRRSRHSSRRTQNNEIGQSSVAERGSSIPQGPSTNNGSPPLPQAEMDTNVGRTASLGEGPTQSTENTSPPALPEDRNSNVEMCSSLHEASRPRSMKVATPLDKGTATSHKKTILSWLIDLKLIDEDEQVYYIDDGRESAALTGNITRVGILCSCCQEEMSVWSFEIHARSNLKQPYRHIFLDKEARCLQHLMIAAWDKDTERKRRETFTFVPKETSLTQHDEACSICGIGGELISCRKCPSAYHAYCMNIGRPHRDWLCPYCICKFCKLGGDSKLLVTCSQCEKKFHWQCFSERSTLKDSSAMSHSRLYCSQSCKEIYEKFDGALETKTDIFDDYSLRVIHPTRRFLPTRTQCLENNLKVAVAYTLMKESFQTIVDPHTGINLVQNVVFGCESNLTRLNFNRFYTFTMEKDDAVICAASLRIHGERIAEMPFVTTDKGHRHRGICGRLMTIIESFLCDLRVQNLVLPSVPDTCDMWKQKFGFNELTAEMKREIGNYNTLMFPGAVRLFKDLTSRTAHPDGGNGNNGNEVENQNAQETQRGQGDRPLLDLNIEPPEEYQ